MKEINERIKEKKELMFEKLSALVNILPYYAAIEGCDCLMRQFTSKTSNIWKKNLPMWVGIFKLDSVQIEIDNLPECDFVKYPLLSEYKIIVYQDQILDDYRLEKILAFINSLPRKDQVKEIVIREGKNPCCVIKFSYSDEEITQVLERMDSISEACGHNKSPEESMRVERPGVYKYYSDIFRPKYFNNLFNGKLKILPEYYCENQLVCIDSKYILGPQQIIQSSQIDTEICSDNCVKFGDPKIPTFEYVERVKIKQGYFMEINPSLENIIKKHYPNLKEIELIRENDFWEISNPPHVLDFIFSTGIKSIFSVEKQYKKHIFSRDRKTKIRTSKFILFTSRSNPRIGYCFHGDLEIDVDNFMVIDDYVLIRDHYLRSIRNLMKIPMCPKEIDNINSIISELNYLPMRRSEVLMVIPKSMISFYQTQGNTFMKKEFMILQLKAKGYDCQSSLNGSYTQKVIQAFYNSLPETCSIILSICNLDDCELIQWDLALALFKKIRRRISLDVKVSSWSTEIKKEFPLDYAKEFKTINFIIDVDKKNSRPKEFWNLLKEYLLMPNVHTISINEWGGRCGRRYIGPKENLWRRQLHLPPSIKLIFV